MACSFCAVMSLDQMRWVDGVSDKAALCTSYCGSFPSVHPRNLRGSLCIGNRRATQLRQDERDKRRADVRAAMATMESPSGLGITVDVEDRYLFSDAIRCYIVGADAGTIFCAHASCERDLAALVKHSGSAPKNSERWGLGSLVSHCVKQRAIPQDLIDGLGVLNDHRKTLYHFGHSESDVALRSRTNELIEELGSAKVRGDFREKHGYDGDNKSIWRFAMDRVLQQNALMSLATAFQLRSWLAPSA